MGPGPHGALALTPAGSVLLVDGRLPSTPLDAAVPGVLPCPACCRARRAAVPGVLPCPACCRARRVAVPGVLRCPACCGARRAAVRGVLPCRIAAVPVVDAPNVTVVIGVAAATADPWSSPG